MPSAVEDPEALVLGMISKALHRHDHRAHHQVRVDLRMEYAHRGIVGARGQQGELTRVEHCPAHCAVMILERLIRLRPEVKVEPHYTPIVRTSNDVISTRMDRERSNPSSTADELLQMFLLLQVVDADSCLRRDKEVRLSRVERAALHLATLHLGEGTHGLLLLECVDDALIRRRSCLRTHGGAVISLRMPGELLNVSIGRNRDPAARAVELGVLWNSMPPNSTSLAALGRRLLALGRHHLSEGQQGLDRARQRGLSFSSCGLLTLAASLSASLF
mmetsp:Transcript_58801/g.127200  ORF Transcript_58801/g.127200 Transcript_58801/m.127200 type:complete len:275 (-) Transcript_58801:1343-2167(-)